MTQERILKQLNCIIFYRENQNFKVCCTECWLILEDSQFSERQRELCKKQVEKGEKNSMARHTPVDFGIFSISKMEGITM